MTVITGETGAGKTLIVDALDLLCGGRADAVARARRRRRGAGRGPVRRRRRRGGARARAARDRTDARLHRRPPRDRGRSSRSAGGRWSTCTGSTRTSRCSFRPSSARSSTATRARRPRRRAPRSARPGPSGAAVDDELAAIGGDDRLARPHDRPVALRARRDRRGRDRGPRRRRGARGEGGAPRRRRGAPGRARRCARAARRTPRSTRSAPRSPRWRARSPFAADRRPAARDPGRARRRRRTTCASRPSRSWPIPQQLAAVQRRRAQLRELERKYGSTLAEVQAYAADARDRLAAIEGHDERAAALAIERADADRAVADAAAALSAARTKAAAGRWPRRCSCASVSSRCPRRRSRSRSSRASSPTAGEDGADDVTFLWRPIRAKPARPLARAASGGELARAMLALRVVLSAAPPTLVFDEVDAGIGGEAGTAVGRALATLGGGHQVLCVTHLAQVAAFADAQVAVSKGETGGRTIAQAEVLLDDARAGEISRMLAGVGESSHARRHARGAARRRARTKRARHGAPVKLRRRREAAPGRDPRHRRASTAARRISSGGSTPGDIAVIDHPTSTASRPTRWSRRASPRW